MRWMIEEARLGDEQKEIINTASTANGNAVWIQGHAGSGKSVVLLHAVRDYLIRNKNARVAIVVFTRSLIDMVKTGIDQTPALVNRNIPVITIYQMKNNLDNNMSYDAIFCDEVQDLPIDLISKMKANCTQLVIAGDAAQSIFDRIPKWNTSPATPTQIRTSVQPIEKSSSIIYRLTRRVINALNNVFRNILGDMAWNGKEDSEIRIFKFSSRDSVNNEISFSWDEIARDNEDRQEDVSAILIYKREDVVKYCQGVLAHLGKPEWVESYIESFGSRKLNLNDLNNHLANNNVPLMYVGNGIGSLQQADRQNKIIIMTYHSAKGLDFDAVCLPFLSTNLGFGSTKKALMLVALSRSKRDLLITFTDTMFSGFKDFIGDIEPIIVEDDDDDDIIF